MEAQVKRKTVDEEPAWFRAPSNDFPTRNICGRKAFGIKGKFVLDATHEAGDKSNWSLHYSLRTETDVSFTQCRQSSIIELKERQSTKHLSFRQNRIWSVQFPRFCMCPRGDQTSYVDALGGLRYSPNSSGVADGHLLCPSGGFAQNHLSPARRIFFLCLHRARSR